MSEMICVADTLLSDMHKDAFGTRPHGLYPEYMTREEYDAERKRLQEAIKESIEEDERLYRESKQAFEDAIERTIKAGATSRADAIRWLYEADEDAQSWGGFDYFMWKNRLLLEDTAKYKKEMEDES